MPGEDSFAERLDVWDPSIKKDDDRKSAEEKDEEGKNEEAPNCKACLDIGEVVKGHPRSDVYEGGNVEEEIDDG